MRYYIAKEITGENGEQKTVYYNSTQLILSERLDDFPEGFEVVVAEDENNTAASPEASHEPIFGDSFKPNQNEDWNNLFFTDDFDEATIFISLENAQRVAVNRGGDIYKYEMPWSEILSRFFSLILAIFIVNPLLFIVLLVQVPYVILNEFRYDNYKKLVLPPQVTEKINIGTGMQSYGFLKIYFLIVGNIISPFIQIFYAYRELKYKLS